MQPTAGNSECQEVQQRFLDLLDGSLEESIRQGLKAHIQGCATCAKHWESYGATVRALGSLEQVEVPGRILERIRARIQRGSRLQRLAAWARMTPWRVPVPAMATVAFLLVLGGLWQWRPWDQGQQTPPQTASVAGSEMRSQVHPLDLTVGPSFQEGILSPVRALDPDLDWPVRGRVMIQDEMVLDLTGSEEVFQRIEAILRESRGKMFLMGVRHRDSGQVIRSRILLEVPMESYAQVIQQIESIAPVQRVFLEREALPPRPDRLRISVVATDSLSSEETPQLQRVRSD
jgi:hypothetical protein